VEWLLDEPARTHLQSYVQAGVVAFLFGRGADGATCACDAAGDGVTNPAAINGNTGTSLNADDDGGFFRQKAVAYYGAGAIPLPNGGGGGGATVISPGPNITLTGASQPFTWTAAQGATGYAVYAGSSAGAYNYFSSLFTGTSGTVTGLPTNGSTVWIRLWTNFSGTWQFIDYQYTSATGGGGGATMVSPAPNTTLGGASQTFVWTTAAGATQYAIYAGSSVGAYNYFSGLLSGTSGNVTGLPTNGSTVWIRLWTNFGGTWQFIDYPYTAVTGGGGGSPATMTSPAPGSALAGASQAFSWTSAQGTTGYAIYAGSSVGAYNYFSGLFSSASGNVTGVPTNGSTVWIRLWTNFSGSWQFIDYQYMAANGGGGVSPATMISPAPGSNIGGTVNFTWTTAAGTTGYGLYVGTTPGGYNVFAGLTNSNMQSVANVPSGTLYVRLWTNFASGWQFVDYSYQ
jgi:hypothetical protein